MAGTLAAGSASAQCSDPPGDINGDGFSNVIDVQCNLVTSLYVLDGETDPLPECLPSSVDDANVNCDETVNVADVLVSINYSLGTPIAAAIDLDGSNCPDLCEDIVLECGDGVCDPAAATPEDCQSCPADCGVCPCGDGVCDPDAAEPETCITCEADCGACTGDCCVGGEAVGCGDGACQDCVCANDPFCCDTQFDDLCAGQAALDCQGTCNCDITGAELSCGDFLTCLLNCDTDGSTCATTCVDSASVADTGAAVALAACSALNSCLIDADPQACLDANCAAEQEACTTVFAEQDCCVGGDLPGCDDAGCVDCVCGADPFCCDTQWDELCVGVAQTDCFDDCGCEVVLSCAETVDCLIACDAGDTECEAACAASVEGGDPAAAIALDACLVTFACSDLPTQAEFDDCLVTNCIDEFLTCVPPPQGDCCADTVAAGCTNETCETCVCAADDFCCTTSWDGACVDTAVVACPLECECGEFTCVGAVNCALGCDAGDTTCVDGCIGATDAAEQGFAADFVGCLLANGCDLAEDQATFDACVAANCDAQEDLCFNGPAGVGGCCAANGTPGCEVGDCQSCVCAFDAECCDVAWDEECAGIAAVDCSAVCGCGGPATCCDVAGAPGCPDATCETCVCGADAFCCDTAYDSVCVQEAASTCEAECGCVPGESACLDVANCQLDCNSQFCNETCALDGLPGTSLPASALTACVAGAGCLALAGDDFNACVQTNCNTELVTCDAFGSVGDNCLTIVNCLLGCPDATCQDACLAGGDDQSQGLSIGFFNCLATNGCLAAPTQEQFDACLVANCFPEADSCFADP